MKLKRPYVCKLEEELNSLYIGSRPDDVMLSALLLVHNHPYLKSVFDWIYDKNRGQYPVVTIVQIFLAYLDVAKGEELARHGLSAHEIIGILNEDSND